MGAVELSATRLPVNAKALAWAPALSAELLEALPAAVYTVDAAGVITGYNTRAAELWGRAPIRGEPSERFCGSVRLFLPDGTRLPHPQCPVAQVLADGRPVRDREVVIEQPDGTRITALVNVVPLRDAGGAIVGAVNCFNDITERKRLEDNLRRSQQDLDDFFENGAVALHWVAADGTILRANQAELDLLGYRREEYVGRRIAAFHVDRSVIDDILARLTRGEPLDKYPARLRAKDGSIKHVLITSNARFRDGRFAHTRCFTLDVTEARRAEEALREREALLRQILEALPVAIYTTDAAGRITFYNQAAIELAGRRPVLGRDEWCVTWRLYRPDGTPLPHDECPMAIALKENRPVRGIEAVAERPDGTRVPILPYPTPLRDASGALVGAVNMLMDLTEIKRAEDSTQRLAAIVESSDDAIVSKDLDGVVKTWNKGAERLFGYTAEEMVDKSITIIIPPERQDEEVTILARIRAGERLEHYETVRRRKDGSLVEISLSVSPITDAIGRVVGASKIARDITERKRAEARLALLAQEVDHRAKNALAVVLGLVRLTRADDATAFKAAVEGRIAALARAHTLLSESRWTGADLARLVAEELAPFTQGRENLIRTRGPALVLAPRAAQSIAMALHELATNAAKYGALSVPGGGLAVEWDLDPDRRLVLRWMETGGPLVGPPSRQGLGTGVIARAVRDQLGGEACFDWHVAGLRCQITVPPSKVAVA